MLGYRVSLDVTEQLIQSKFGVDCACAGNDDKMKIYFTKKINQDEVKKFISEKTGINSSLFDIFIIDEMPRTDSGKIVYSKL